MANTLFHSNTSRRNPYWRNLPPIVPRYITMEEMLSPFRPKKFTASNSKNSYQIWMDKWHDFNDPHLKKEEMKPHHVAPEVCWTPNNFQLNMSSVAEWTKEGKDWPINKRFFVNGKPDTETLRTRALNRIVKVPDNFYSHSNFMTSSYRLPVLTAFGPLQRNATYGITHQHNRHGFMTFEDYY